MAICMTTFNYDKEKGRDASTLGDAFAVEILNRFSVEAERQMKEELPAVFCGKFTRTCQCKAGPGHTVVDQQPITAE